MATDKPAVLEAERRASIVRRYSRIESPTLLDDERFAAELGLSVDTLYRLARLWRHHEDPALLTGARTKSTAVDLAAALAATADPDLSGVNPTRRPLIRSRIAALRSFLQITQPTREDEIASATAIGMSPDAFRRLYRSWVLARDPAALPGGSTPARTPKRRSPAISQETERVIAEAIAALGPDASSLAVHRKVAERCKAEGLPPPDRSTVYYRFVAARATMQRNEPPSIAVDHSALALPVTGADGDQLPVLSAVVQRPSGRILAHRLSLEPPTAATTAKLLAEALGRMPAGDRRVPLQLGAPKGADWDGLTGTLMGAAVSVDTGPTRSLRAGHFLTRTFGEALGRLRLRPRIATRPRDVPIRRMGRGSVPLSLDEARTVVDGIVDDLNAARPDQRLSLLDERSAGLLKESLLRLAASR